MKCIKEFQASVAKSIPPSLSASHQYPQCKQTAICLIIENDTKAFPKKAPFKTVPWWRPGHNFNFCLELLEQDRHWWKFWGNFDKPNRRTQGLWHSVAKCRKNVKTKLCGYGLKQQQQKTSENYEIAITIIILKSMLIFISKLGYILVERFSLQIWIEICMGLKSG